MPNSVLIDREKCTGCGICAKVCPVDVFDIADKKSIATRVSKCMGCQLCEVECPVAAITVQKVAAKASSPWGTGTAAERPPKEKPLAADIISPVSTAPSQVFSTPSTKIEKQEDYRRPSLSAPPLAVQDNDKKDKKEESDWKTGISTIVSAPTRIQATKDRPTQVEEKKPAETQPPSSTTFSWDYPALIRTPKEVDTAGVIPGAATFDTPAGSPEESRKVLTVFPDLCVNCRICELVCSLKHTGEFNPYKACLKITRNGDHGPYVPTICRHCHKAACEAACPTKALFYQGRIVMLDRTKCIGCLECVRACPFAAIQVGPSGEIYKCDLCGGDPVCAKYCPPRPENTGGRIAHPKASAIQYVESHNVNAMRRLGLAASKK